VGTTSIRRGAAALGLLALAGCGSTTDEGGSASDSGSPSRTDAVLGTSDTDLGEIVVAGSGRTVYVFDKDTDGTSACSGACAENWPAVAADTAEPTVDGVTADVGTISRDDGTMQVTLDGMPLYTYAGDSDAGDVSGQGVQGVWWVVAADGAKVTAAPSPEPAAVPGY
jgi:predicted lipoprotein with Yx(FWY)xxD motif